MGTRSYWYRLTALILLTATGLVAAQDLDRRVERRLSQVEQHLDRAQSTLEQGNLEAARSAMGSAEREWKALDSYTGKFDPAHPRIQATADRLESLQQALEEGGGDAPPPEVETPDRPSGEAEIPKQELDGAEHYLEEFEELVRLADGKPISRGAMGQEALQRIRDLGERYPGHSKVLELIERARKAIRASKGQTVDITPGMLAYRDIPKIIQAQLEEETAAAWTRVEEEVKASERPLLDPFPPPDPRQVAVDTVVGSQILLPGVIYPDNEFSYLSSQYIFVGSPSRGYYYVNLGSRAWLGAYEALRRYRRQVSGEFPQHLEWVVAGEITGLHLLVPQAGEEKTMNAHLGWLVEPRAIQVPGYTVSWYDPEREDGGTFAGEERVAAIKEEIYTVKEIPENATPEQLIEVYATAVKEKNYDLFLECIDPLRKQTPAAIKRIGYHWDLHQHRFATFYVHVQVARQEIKVLRGFEENEFETWFLTEADRERIRTHSEPLLERATIWLKAFDERGRQFGSTHPLYLRRYAKARWLVEEASWPL